MKKKMKKLQLHRETLSYLSYHNLPNVLGRGGSFGDPDSCVCPTEVTCHCLTEDLTCPTRGCPETFTC